jgi:DNA-directed RNA polymerase subunit delta
MGGLIMKLKSMKKEQLELLSNKDIAEMILEESKRKLNTADLFTKIIKLLDLPQSTFEKKIADFYTALSTDKRFILLENGKWDLRSNHTSDKVIKVSDEDDEEEEISEEEKEEEEEEDLEEDSFDDTEEEEYDEDTNEELKDLVVIDEDELELEV